jgi:hypothetical protein
MQDQRVTDHRQLGVDLFNETWRLIESREDDALMIDCAHASAYHWALAPECKPENRARSAWQISRAYTVAGRPDEALYHADRCFQLCERYGLADWDLAYAYEALARASLTAGDREAVGQYVELAQAVEIADDGDRAHLAGDLKTLR